MSKSSMLQVQRDRFGPQRLWELVCWHGPEGFMAEGILTGH